MARRKTQVAPEEDAVTEEQTPQTPQQQAEQESQQTDSGEQTEGQVDPGASANQMSEVAEKVGLTEGELRELQTKAQVVGSPGHMSNIDVWAASSAGQAEKEAQEERDKAEEDYEKSYKEQVNDDGLHPALVEFREKTEQAT